MGAKQFFVTARHEAVSSFNLRLFRSATLLTQCQTIDTLINRLAYDLNDLTEEEIKIVEGEN
jgi:hypothetical protein